MEEIINKALEKMNDEMLRPHSDSIDSIHNWLCSQTSDIELMKAVLTEGKSVNSSLAYVTEKVKRKATRGCAVLSDDEVFGMVRNYYLGLDSELKIDPSVKIAKGSKEQELENEQSPEMRSNSVEIKVSLNKKSEKSIKAIFDLDVSAEEKMRLIKGLVSDAEKSKNAKDDEVMSIFDFGVEEVNWDVGTDTVQ